MGRQTIQLTSEQAKAKREAKLQQKRDHYHANKKSILAYQKQYRQDLQNGVRVIGQKDDAANGVGEPKKAVSNKVSTLSAQEKQKKIEIAAEKQRGYNEKWRKKMANEKRERILEEHRKKYPNG